MMPAMTPCVEAIRRLSAAAMAEAARAGAA